MSDTAPAARASAIEAAGWGEAFRLRQPHNPAFWLYVGAVALGAVHFANQVTNVGHQFMTAIVTSSLLWALYCVPWVWFLHHRDRFGRETRKLALVAFAWGGLAATWLMALPGNAAMLSIFSKLFDGESAQALGPAFVAPLVEESSKGVGVVMLVLLASRHIRTSYDGFILGAYVGLGFQVFEDWLYGVNASVTAFGFDQAQHSLMIFVQRGGIGGLVSHTLYTALVGAGVGAWVELRGQPLGPRLLRTVGPIAAALVAHGVWDFAAFSGVSAVGTVVAGFSVAMVGITYRWTNRQLRPWISDLLSPEVDAGLVTDEELTAMTGSPKDRRAYVKSARHEHGKEAGKATRHVLDAELDLVEALGDSRGQDSDEVAHARSELVRLRAELDAATTG